MPFVPTKPQPVLTKAVHLNLAEPIHTYLESVAKTHSIQVSEVIEQFLGWAVESRQIMAKATRPRISKNQA